MNILLSIKPEFVERIFSGEKKFEYRKSIFKRNDVERVVIYSTLPEGKVVGEFSIKTVHNSSPKMIWRKTRVHSGVNKQFYDLYFNGRDSAYAIEIGEVVKYDRPLDLSELEGGLSAPQSFTYLHNDSLPMAS